ncbi:asparagine synthase (glutamine-hydrolyzing) [Sphingosinicella rhizophila]|uniref:asparagine synthase (glutamine-hydrolyzing) n=1 Tax=Sphingosinicella rhizophila TaxID=3050082 RepID=A0ABU3Q8B6_9SPHN|nr:asparagine synthase (glutamine-hydrolyzing) [Sphingosinicella sp. GR2756]MDT9599646.1 asparagine synthase (glutamine-hydrolyzing) [Sphingosinicella sp. GR2756]
MCGIAGIIAGGGLDAASVKRMTDPIAHRGPDDEGVWLDAQAGVGLGHRRLAIVDLSPLGHQPMGSSDGRYILSYNGEIYNHAALRGELEAAGLAPAWRGHSDTETLVECIAAWGLETTLRKCVGMFALGLWDRKERLLHLARDRFGEKPLYYGWTGGDFVFASELKALRSHPRFANEIDRSALRLFAARTYIPAPLSIYRHIYKLQPGCILTASTDVAKTAPSGAPRIGSREGGLSIAAYWSYRAVVAQGLADPIGQEDEALERLEAALAEAIKGQAVADVPVGAFLSGGIDSSTVVALYQKYSSGKVSTFTIGFEEAGFNEAEYAKQVARHFGTAHHENYVTFREAQALIPSLPAMYDEPFADSSQIPTHLVSRFAREQVTVALSGDGGDELFGGYNRYFGTARLWSQMKRLPRPVRALAGGGLGHLPPGFWNGLSDVLPGGRRPPHFGVKVQKTFRTLGAASGLGDVFTTFLNEWSGERSPVLDAGGAPGECAFDLDIGAAPDAVRMMYCDAVSYLPDDILCKVDRAAMAVSLETRVPFLDHRVAELAARMPVEMKIKGGVGKHILRRLLYREAPAAMFERPKAGFAVPVGEWIRGPLRPWAESLLDHGRLADQGLFDAAIVHRRWQQHLRGERDSTPALWALLMFQAWQEDQRSSAARAAA